MEVNAAKALDELIGILLHDPNGLVTILPIDLDGQFRRNAVIDEIVHCEAFDLLFRPTSGDEVATLLTDTFNGEELFGMLLDHGKNLHAEGFHESLRVSGTDCLHQSGTQTLLDFDRIRRKFRADGFRTELMSALTGLPAAGRPHA